MNIPEHFFFYSDFIYKWQSDKFRIQMLVETETIRNYDKGFPMSLKWELKIDKLQMRDWQQ